MENYNESQHINIGAGIDVSIKELAHIIKDIVGYNGKFIWDETKPDGMPQKLMDVSRINALGWINKTNLEDGLTKTYKWYLDNWEKR
jgi:GDP-L-fucose synthase